MIRFFIYLLIFGGVLYFLSVFGKKQGAVSAAPVALGSPSKNKHRFKPKLNPNEIWVQVYETETLDEARKYQARIQEDDLACIIYEQGKKDIHGNELKGIGIAVPKTSTGLAQGIISRMSV